MIKKDIILLFAFLILPILALFSPEITGNATYGIECPASMLGNGTLENPCIVTNCIQLQAMNESLGANYTLGNNIDCGIEPFNTGLGFIPIGDANNVFQGNLDGQNYNISNLLVNLPSTDYVGLFGTLSGNITSVNILNCSVMGKAVVGCLVGHQGSRSKVSNSMTTGKVNAESRSGGLVGFSIGNISNSYSSSNVTCTGDYCGGLAGWKFEGLINNSYSIGKVIGDFAGIGGFVGWMSNNANIMNSFSTGDVTGSFWKGGFVGKIEGGTISNSFWLNKATNPSSCYYGGNNGCTAETDENYFYNISNAPMNLWNFIEVWDDSNSDISYPPIKKIVYSEHFYNDSGTIKCEGSNPGDIGKINGIIFTAVDNDMLAAMDPETDDYTKICTSNVTNMSSLFFYSSFNQDINNWDTSNVLDMSYMFSGSDFNSDISAWDVSFVTDMEEMFFGSSFNQDINNWDVSFVETMSYMFSESDFDGNISDWDVSSVQNMNGMFNDAIFNQNISAWDTSSVTTMLRMFVWNPNFNQNISAWNVSFVTDMRYMFRGVVSFNQDLSSWCVKNIESKPTNFDSGATLFENQINNQPQWGTCPVRPNSCLSNNPPSDLNCSKEVINFEEDVNYSVSVNFSNSTINATKIYIKSSSTIIYEDVTTTINDLIIENNSNIEFKNNKAPIKIKNTLNVSSNMTITNSSLEAETVRIKDGGHSKYENTDTNITNLIIDKGAKIEFKETAKSININNDFNVSSNATFTNSRAKIKKFRVMEGGDVKCDNISVNISSLMVEKNSSLEFSNGGNTVWVNDDVDVYGKLIWNHEKIRVNASENEEFTINVHPGGELIIINNTNITNGEQDYKFNLNINGNFTIDNASIQNLNKLSIGNNYGKIEYYQNDILDIYNATTATISISNNSIIVNSSKISALNQSANITIYGADLWGLSNPIIKKDNQECTDCYNFTSLTASEVIFYVKSFSEYSLGEKEVEEVVVKQTRSSGGSSRGRDSYLEQPEDKENTLINKEIVYYTTDKFEIDTKTTNEFYFNFKNTFKEKLINATISFTGLNSNNFEVYPQKINDLLEGEKVRVNVEIINSNDLGIGENKVSISIDGVLNSTKSSTLETYTPFSEKKTLFLDVKKEINENLLVNDEDSSLLEKDEIKIKDQQVNVDIEKAGQISIWESLIKNQVVLMLLILLLIGIIISFIIYFLYLNILISIKKIKKKEIILTKKLKELFTKCFEEKTLNNDEYKKLAYAIALKLDDVLTKRIKYEFKKIVFFKVIDNKSQKLKLNRNYIIAKLNQIENSYRNNELDAYAYKIKLNKYSSALNKLN